MEAIKTERLILREVTLDDTSDLYKYWGSDKKTNYYLTFKLHTSIEDTKKMVERIIKLYDMDNKNWIIEYDKKAIGMISSSSSYKYKCEEIGYSISSLYQGKGIAYEACKAVINYLFNNDVNIIEAVIPSKNIASIKLAEKLGMSKEAVLKDRYMDKNKELNNLYIYSIFNNN